MKHAGKAQKAFETMGQEVMRDVMGEMGSQMKNVEIIKQRYLDEARE
jgi:hypothetical protein